MKTHNQSRLGALFLGALFFTIGLAGSGAAEDASGTPISRLAPGHANQEIGVPGDKEAAKSGIVAAYGQLPLAFEPNQGQSDAQVKFLCRGPGYSLFLTESESVLVLGVPEPGKAASKSGGTAVAHAASSNHATAPRVSGGGEEVLRFKLLGATAHPQAMGVDPLPGRSNYFIGNDPKKWRTNIPQYARVASTQVYPGIDLVYYGRQHRLEYDFRVAPGADPGAIRFAVEGASPKIDLDAQGNLLLHAPAGDVIEQAPVIYQEIGGKRKAVAGSFELHSPRSSEAALTKSEMSVGFRVASYDRSKPLIIDPALVYSTYLGGSNRDEGNGIAVDSSGHAYVTGYTESTDFPTTVGAFQKTNKASAGSGTVFVTKLGPAGAALVYSTYLGGNGADGHGDQGNGIAVDGSGCAYVTGFAYSTNFPTTAGAFQKTNNGASEGSNAFVTKLGPAGAALDYSTYLGGSGGDEGEGIAVDSSGSAYVTGYTGSTDFPATVGAFQRKTKGAGGTSNAFVTKLGPAGAALVYSTYLGGSGSNGSGDQGNGIAVDSSGHAYVTGFAYSTNFPTTAGAFQTTNKGAGNSATNAFATKLGPAGAALVYSTYLGGSGNEERSYGDEGRGIAVDSSGSAYVTGDAYSTNFPTTAGAFQTTSMGAGNGTSSAFVTKLGPAGAALVYSTYLGGSGNGEGGNGDEGYGIAVDSSGGAYVTGAAYSTNFPTTAGAFQKTNEAAGGLRANAFVTKLGPGGVALDYSTYLGGSGSNGGPGDQGAGIAVDGSGNAYVTGQAYSSDFPATAGAFQRTNNAAANFTSNAFVTKINAE